MTALLFATHLIFVGGSALVSASAFFPLMATAAIIGALYLDGGEQAAHAFIQRAIMDDIDALLTMVQSRNFKGELLEYCQRKFHTTPRYELRGQEGLAHSKTYTMEVRVNGEIFGDGVGSSKKEAEQRAAEKALDTIGGHYPR